MNKKEIKAQKVRDAHLSLKWKKREKLRAEASKLRTEANKLFAEGDKLFTKLCAETNKLHTEKNELCAEGSRLYAKRHKLYTKGRKLQAEGDELIAEGDELYIDAVIEAYGPKAVINWNNGSVKNKEIETQKALGTYLSLKKKGNCR